MPDPLTPLEKLEALAVGLEQEIASSLEIVQDHNRDVAIKQRAASGIRRYLDEVALIA